MKKRGLSLKYNRTIFYLVVFTTFFIFNTPLVDSSCCFLTGSDYWCQGVDKSTCCGGSDCPWDTGTCGVCSAPGCCLDTCTFTTYGACESYGFVTMEACGTINNSGYSDCIMGCCIRKDNGLKLEFEEDIAEHECQPHSEDILTNDFYPGVTSQVECEVLFNTSQVGSLTGHIFNLSSGELISNSTSIQIKVSGTLYNVNNPFTISNIPIGMQLVRAYGEGFSPSYKTVNILPGDTIELNFSLGPISEIVGYISGYVINQTGGNPIRSAVVWYNIGSETSTDPNGYYEGISAPPGLQQITATYSEFSENSTTVNVIAGINVLAPNITLTPQSIAQCNHNGSIDAGEICDKYDNNSCGGEQEICLDDCTCAQLCSEVQDADCCTWEFQCDANNGTTLSTNSDCGGGICCNTSCYSIPQCFSNNIDSLKSTISQTAINNNHSNYVLEGGIMCECGEGAYYDFTTDPGFCCNLEPPNYFYSTELCGGGAGELRGYVYDDLGSPINGASVELTPSLYATTTPSGYYSIIGIPEGTYTVTVSATGHITNQTSGIFIPAGGPTDQDFILPIDYAECSTSTIPAPVLSVSHIKGKKQVQLSWTQDCESLVREFKIIRVTPYLSRTLNATLRSYLDDEYLNWWDYPNYKIRVYSVFGPENVSESFTVHLGVVSCENVYDEDEECMDTSYEKISRPYEYRTYCNDSNDRVLVDDCSANNQICLGPQEGVTWCGNITTNKECAELGLTKTNFDSPQDINPFGIYYYFAYEYSVFGTSSFLNCTHNISSGLPRYCYLDYSDTTQDKCYSCINIDSCYDYSSTNACLQDNCGLSGCSWFETTNYFSDFGKGLCYDTNYNGTDKCDLCSIDNSLFTNTQCTPEVCARLGNCIPSGGSCAECPDEIKCSDYTTEYECTKLGNNFSFIGQPASCTSSSKFEYSKDSCGLGKCKWTGLSCIKDADDDNTPDPGDVLDYSAPLTEVSLPASKYVNADDAPDIFDFEVTSAQGIDVDSLYYCLDDNSTICCPSYSLGLDDKLESKLQLPNEDFPLIDIEGLYYLRYYSSDINGNVELIKTREFEIDTKKPTIEAHYYYINDTGPTDSILIVNFTVDESSTCTGNVQQGTDDFHTAPNNLFILGGDTFTANFSGMEDGSYTYTVMCTDDYDNNNTNILNIRIDRIHVISDMEPNGTINKTIVQLKWKTTDYLYCYYNNSGSWNYSGPSAECGADCYQHSVMVAVPSNDLHMFPLKCEDTFPTGTIMDKDTIIFTVDKEAPTTNILKETFLGTGVFIPLNDTKAHKNNSAFRLECNDPDIPVGYPSFNPGEFGCGTTSYCVNTSPCTPNTNYNGEFALDDFLDPIPTGAYYACYNSTDTGENNESVKCSQMIIDSIPPRISTSSPMDKQPFNNQFNIDVSGTWIDDRNKVNIDVIVLSPGLPNKVFKATIYPEGTFTAKINISEGINLVYAYIEDEALNADSSVPMTIYYDNAPPVFTRAVVHQYISQEGDLEAMVVNQDFSLDIDHGDEIHITAYLEDEFTTYGCPCYPAVSDAIPFVNVSIECLAGLCAGYDETFELNPGLFPAPVNFSRIFPPTGELAVGNFSLFYYTEDIFGHKSNYTQTISIVDNIYPTISIKYPNEDFEYLYDDTPYFCPDKANSIEINGTYIESNLDYIEILVQSSMDAAQNSTYYAYTWEESNGTHTTFYFKNSSISLFDGENSITVMIIDKSGNQDYNYTSIIKDVIPPEFDSASPMDFIFENIAAAQSNSYLEFGKQNNLSITVEITDEITDNLSLLNASITCLTGVCGYQIDSLTLNYSALDEYSTKISQGISPLTTGKYSVMIQAYDLCGNNNVTYKNFTVNDTIAPYFNIALFEDPAFTQKVTTIGGLGSTWYFLINSSESLKEKPLLNYTFYNDYRFRYASINDAPLDGYYLLWGGTLTIFAEDAFYGLDPDTTGESTFHIYGFDNQSTPGNVITQGSEFKIDTKGPPAPIIKTPDPAAVIYTMEPTGVTIHGYEYNKTPDVKVMVQITDEYHVSSPAWESHQIYTSSGANLLRQFGDDAFENLTAVGQNYIRVEYPESFGNPFGSDEFIGFAEEDYHRLDGKHYDILNSVNISFELYQVNFTENLDDVIITDGIAAGIINVYDKREANGWFNKSFDLVNESAYYIRAAGFDEFNNVGDYSAVVTVVYDLTPPTIEPIFPTNGSTTYKGSEIGGDLIIQFRISDLYSGIEHPRTADVLDLTFDGTPVSISDISVLSDPEPFIYIIDYNVEKLHNSSCGQHPHNVSATISDKSGYQTQLNWTFFIDPCGPEMPEYYVTEGYKYAGEGKPYSWYSKNPLLMEIKFDQYLNTYDIDVTNISLYKNGSTILTPIKYNCTGLTNLQCDETCKLDKIRCKIFQRNYMWCRGH